MNILIFSSFIIFVIFLLQYFTSAKKGKKILVVFGIALGFLALGLNHLLNSCFGASTPIDIEAKNLSTQNLRIYTIAFWKDFHKGDRGYTTYDTELKPNETSKFCIDNDGGKFWIVGKNDNDEIKYLEENLNSKNNFNFRITSDNKIDKEKAQIATELTFKKDKSVEFEKYLVWANIILILLLIFSLLKNKNSW